MTKEIRKEILARYDVQIDPLIYLPMLKFLASGEATVDDAVFLGSTTIAGIGLLAVEKHHELFKGSLDRMRTKALKLYEMALIESADWNGQAEVIGKLLEIEPKLVFDLEKFYSERANTRKDAVRITSASVLEIFEAIVSRINNVGKPGKKPPTIATHKSTKTALADFQDQVILRNAAAKALPKKDKGSIMAQIRPAVNEAYITGHINQTSGTKRDVVDNFTRRLKRKLDQMATEGFLPEPRFSL